MAVATPFPVTRASGEIIKYGDVEKEKEIEKRLKELGLWESKVYQEEQVEKMLEEKIDNSDKLSQVIKRVRRRRQRSEGNDRRQEKEETKEERNDKSEGRNAMDEIRNIVKPTIIRDTSGMQLAYHIDIMMGCFTHDVSHSITNGGYMVVVFGATAPSSTLLSSAFLSSKSLPSLLSPAMSPQAAEAKNSDNVNSSGDASVNASAPVGSTVRYGRLNKNSNRDNLENRERKTAQNRINGHNCDDDDDDDDGDDDDDVVDTKRLTKEISIELPQTVDASQLDVSYRKGVFKIRVPFFLLQSNALPTQNKQQETAQSQNHNRSSHSNQTPSSFPTKHQKIPDHLKSHLPKTFTGSSFSPKVHLPQRLSDSPSSLSPSLSPSLTQPTTNKAFHYSVIQQPKGPPRDQIKQSRQITASSNSSLPLKSSSTTHRTSSSSSLLPRPSPQPLPFLPSSTQTDLTTLSVSTEPSTSTNRSSTSSSSSPHLLSISLSRTTPQFVAPEPPSAFQSPLSTSSPHDSQPFAKKPFSNRLLTTTPPAKDTPQPLARLSTSNTFPNVLQTKGTEINRKIQDQFEERDLSNQNILVKRRQLDDKKISAIGSSRNFSFVEDTKNNKINFSNSQYFPRNSGSCHGDSDNNNDACDNQGAPSNLDNHFQARKNGY